MPVAVIEGREELMDDDKRQWLQKTDLRKLSPVIAGADVFPGLSAYGSSATFGR